MILSLWQSSSWGWLIIRHRVLVHHSPSQYRVVKLILSWSFACTLAHAWTGCKKYRGQRIRLSITQKNIHVLRYRKKRDGCTRKKSGPQPTVKYITDVGKKKWHFPHRLSVFMLNVIVIWNSCPLDGWLSIRHSTRYRKKTVVPPAVLRCCSRITRARFRLIRSNDLSRIRSVIEPAFE